MKEDWKKCTKCNKILQIENFSRRLNGLYPQSWCKDCYRIYNRSKKRREYNHRWRVDNNYDSKGLPRIRRDAAQRVRYAVNKGVLLKESCLICGNKEVHGHHEDYTKPLKVVWLCPHHHRLRHRGLKCQIG